MIRGIITEWALDIDPAIGNILPCFPELNIPGTEEVDDLLFGEIDHISLSS